MPDSLRPHGQWPAPSSSVHGIFQARVLEWIAISFSRGSSQPRDQTQVSRIVDRHFTVWATREVHSNNLLFNLFFVLSLFICVIEGKVGHIVVWLHYIFHSYPQDSTGMISVEHSQRANEELSKISVYFWRHCQCQGGNKPDGLISILYIWVPQ